MLKHLLRKRRSGAESLERIKRWPSTIFNLGPKARIYSMEHRAFWRYGAHGYTNDKSIAGVWERDEAIKLTHHCGPEKEIIFHTVESANT